jgi:hypothetical protein
MKTYHIAGSLLLIAISFALITPVHAQKKPKPKTAPPKPVAKTPKTQPGVKGASQMTGGAIRFGEIFALKTGFTYQILSARYSIDPFADFVPTTGAEEKFLVLTIAIKNNRKEDNWFNTDNYVFQAVDAMNQNYEDSSCILSSDTAKPLSPTLKPGQGLGQNAADPVLVAVKLPMSAKLVKVILKQGREGTSEEVLRFFLADATEAEAGGKPDPKNIITPLPKWAEKGAVIPQGQYVPSGSFYFKLDSFSKAEKLGDTDAEEGKQWVFANITLKNPRHANQIPFSFYAGDSLTQMVLIDGDGEKYSAGRFLKAKSDEEPSSDMEPREEKTFRIAFQVPKAATFKTVRLGTLGYHQFVFDASMVGK